VIGKRWIVGAVIPAPEPAHPWIWCGSSPYREAIHFHAPGVRL